MKQTLGQIVEKPRKIVKDNYFSAVLFDKGLGFCVMKKKTYEKEKTHLQN